MENKSTFMFIMIVISNLVVGAYIGGFLISNSCYEQGNYSYLGSTFDCEIREVSDESN